jgi:hypothetical protein
VYPFVCVRAKKFDDIRMLQKVEKRQDPLLRLEAWTIRVSLNQLLANNAITLKISSQKSFYNRKSCASATYLSIRAWRDTEMLWMYDGLIDPAKSTHA